MNLNHLQYFRVLARTEHYGKAAQELFISQPSLSYAIASLERELGTKLFEKNGRNITLTKYARSFAQSVENAFAELEDAEDALRKITGSPGGHIDLSYYHTLGVHFVPGIIRSYLRHRENRLVTFSLRQQSSEETIRALMTGRCDLGFCTYVDPHKHPEIRTFPVKKEYFRLVVPTGHPLAELERVSLSVIADYPFVTFSQNSGLRPVIDEILDRWQMRPTIAFEAEQGSAVAGIVAAGLGIALLPEIPLPEMDIRQLPLIEPLAPRVTYLAMSGTHYVTNAVRAFQQFVLDRHRCGPDQG